MKNYRWISKEEIQKESLKYESKSLFKKNSHGAYLAAKKMGILEEICSHMKILRYTYTYEELSVEALKYKTRGLFYEYSKSAYKQARLKGILDRICSHMEESICKPWTFNEILFEAVKYKTKPDFLHGCSVAYFAAYRMGVIEQVCSHMPKDSRLGMIPANKKWTTETLREEALKYKKISDFRQYSSGAYSTARKMKILEKICSHMPRGMNTSQPEEELVNIIKEFLPSIKKERDRGVKIEGKPYMHGFDIDGFVPELNLGIEFDGPYHHSFKYMRSEKSKKLWSDDDIRNYHEIKDAWFATKGIKILHIKWEDWKKDKQSCIDRCLAFFGLKQEMVA